MSDDNKERLAQWMIRNSLATGHGDTFEDLLTELEWQLNELKLPEAFSKNCRWLIWSREHGAWWMPRSWGYTRDLDHAGRYSLEQAAAICEHANRYSEQVQETMFPAPK